MYMLCTGVYVMPEGPRGDMRPDRVIGQTSPVLRSENEKLNHKSWELGARFDRHAATAMWM